MGKAPRATYGWCLVWWGRMHSWARTCLRCVACRARGCGARVRCVGLVAALGGHVFGSACQPRPCCVTGQSVGNQCAVMQLVPRAWRLAPLHCAGSQIPRSMGCAQAGLCFGLPEQVAALQLVHSERCAGYLLHSFTYCFFVVSPWCLRPRRRRFSAMLFVGFPVCAG